ncbi:hypothetical protein E2C01_093550 [Portunus trituberculatus]|uniref:Uncharacterized protein n=1 Tax=Portunus trituberculatus TaxID=210409 RepID=A0A5B7K0R6_PORTR|nr:hypothetical protein [Portunus trituberculatus]
MPSPSSLSICSLRNPWLRGGAPLRGVSGVCRYRLDECQVPAKAMAPSLWPRRNKKYGTT